MPFTKPYKDKLEEGDLVYGLSSERRHYFGGKSSVFSSSELEVLIKDRVLIIDQYATDSNELKEQDPLKRKIPENQPDFIKSLNTNPKHAAIWNYSTGPLPNIPFYENGYDNFTRWGRKCKGGLFWVSTLNNNMTIHFILDGIDMIRMVTKETYLYEGINSKPITGSELRWIYRNRDNPKVAKCIQFWLNGSPTAPPWEGDAKYLWLKYEPKSKLPESERQLLKQKKLADHLLYRFTQNASNRAGSLNRYDYKNNMAIGKNISRERNKSMSNNKLTPYEVNAFLSEFNVRKVKKVHSISSSDSGDDFFLGNFSLSDYFNN